MLLVLWGCLEGRAVSLLLLASGSTLKIWCCSFIAASSLTVLCCQNINQPSYFSFPSLLHPPPVLHRPCAERASGVFRGTWPALEWICEEFLCFSLFSHLIGVLLRCPRGNTVLGAERRKSARPRAKQLVINRKKLWFKRNETVMKGFLTWSWHVLLIKSAVDDEKYQSGFAQERYPICFVLNQKDQPKCMNGSDHFQC